MEEKIKRPVLPEVETTDYEAQAEAQIAEAKRQAELQEKRAKRDRDMAVLGDIANLVSKGAAMHGGAWKINKDEPMAAQGNAKLRALQESNSKQMAEYARMRMAAQDANRKQRNAVNEAQYKADLAAYKDAVEAERYAKEQEYKAREEERKDKQEERQIAESIARIERDNAYADYYKNDGNRKSGSSSSVNRDVFLVNDDGTRTEFAYADDPNNLQAAYAEIVKRDPSYKIKKEVKLYKGDSLHGTVPDLNSDGTWKTKLVDASLKEITDSQMKQVVANYNARKLRGAGIQWDDENDENNKIDEDFR